MVCNSNSPNNKNYAQATAPEETIMKKITLIASLLALATASGSVTAKVGTQEANKLGKTLTSVGAQTSGNANGSIPSYKGGLEKNTTANPYENIFGSEKPLFVITTKNLEKYKSNLTPGQLALFAKYPDSYSMPIYQTHRTASIPGYVADKIKKNATTSELADGGNGLLNFDEVIPFAIPKNGVEVMWNHQTRYRGGNTTTNMATLPVELNGSFVPVKVSSKTAFPQYLDGGKSTKDDNILFYYIGYTRAPTRLTGNVVLVHETLDQVTEPRKSWIYNAGQRRVRRAPQVGYDSPDTDGLRTGDQIDMFNGATDRYNWKLVGKKEIYIPYNSYKLMDQNAKYEDIVNAGHIDQNFTRYELHRVWHVEATLKEGSRHIYAKRSFYVDEDSWQIAVSDSYDARGELWRIGEGHAMQFVNADVLYYSGTTNYDLLSGRYMVELSNEEHEPFTFGSKMKRKQFTSSAIRRSAKR